MEAFAKGPRESFQKIGEFGGMDIPLTNDMSKLQWLIAQESTDPIVPFSPRAIDSRIEELAKVLNPEDTDACELIEDEWFHDVSSRNAYAASPAEIARAIAGFAGEKFKSKAGSVGKMGITLNPLQNIRKRPYSMEIVVEEGMTVSQLSQRVIEKLRQDLVEIDPVKGCDLLGSDEFGVQLVMCFDGAPVTLPSCDTVTALTSYRRARMNAVKRHFGITQVPVDVRDQLVALMRDAESSSGIF